MSIAKQSQIAWTKPLTILSVLFLTGMTAIALHAYSQKAPAAPAGVYTISDNVNLVVLEASVRDPRGGYLTGLTKNDFHIFEDGHPRDISQFASIDAPVSVGLVVDNSGSMRFKRREVVMAGLAFARESNSKDEFFVVNFNNSVTRGLPPQLPFTDDLQILRRALYYGNPQGQTALYDAVAYALRHLEYGHHEKRTLIVVSDGGDNVSAINFAELLGLIEASRASIYTVGLYDPDDRDLNPGVLRKISAVSGGQFFQPEKLEDIDRVFHKIATDIRNSYTLAFVPDEKNDKRTVRTLKVIATEENRKLPVRTRTTYRTTPLSDLIAQQSKRVLH